MAVSGTSYAFSELDCGRGVRGGCAGPERWAVELDGGEGVLHADLLRRWCLCVARFGVGVGVHRWRGSRLLARMGIGCALAMTMGTGWRCRGRVTSSRSWPRAGSSRWMCRPRTVGCGAASGEETCFTLPDAPAVSCAGRFGVGVGVLRVSWDAVDCARRSIGCVFDDDGEDWVTPVLVD